MITRIYSFINNMSIKHKLFISYILIICLPFALFMLINNFIISNDTKSKAIYSSHQMLNQASTFIEHKVELISNTMTAVVVSDDVQTLMKQNPDKYRENFSIWNYDMQKVKDHIFSLQPRRDILHIRLYMKDSVTDIEETDSFLNIKNIESTSWFKMLSSSKSTLEWLPNGSFPQIEKEKYISAVRKIYNTDNLRELIGLIRVDIPENMIKQILTQAKYTESSTVLMMNGNKNVICSSTESNNVDPSLISFISSNYRQDNSGNVIWKIADMNSGKSLVCIQSIKGTNWVLALSVPYNDILSLFKKARNNMIIIILLVALFALPISFFMASSATKRFLKLISHMKKVETGNFNVGIIPSNNDEIGQLTRHFNHMLTKIAMLLDEKYELGKDIKNKELKALQAQINPHFLYNTLDQINWMAIRSNTPEICSLVKDLSTFYKLSLSKGEDIVTIGNELEHAKTYIVIQNVRFDNAINLIIDVSKDLYSFKIPKLILQPIVENSILHGILEKDSESGTIRIYSERSDNSITIFVQDDGIGMSEETVQNILNGDNACEFSGYGIKNINERLTLLYGDSYGLSYESRQGYGTTVSIKIPATH